MSEMQRIGQVLPFVARRPAVSRPAKGELIEIPGNQGQPPLYLTPQEFAKRGGRTITTANGGTRLQLGYCRRADGEWLYWDGPGEDAIETGERYRALDERCKAGRQTRPAPRRSFVQGLDD
jgi:hypothetical protein